jgi:hypothetical protein
VFHTIQQGSLSSRESSNENSSFSVSIVGTCFDGPGCRQCNRRHIQGFRVEYGVVCAKKNNKYVETEMGIVKKTFWAVACNNEPCCICGVVEPAALKTQSYI